MDLCGKNKSHNVVLGPLVGMLGSSLRVFLSLLWKTALFLPPQDDFLTLMSMEAGWSPLYQVWKLRLILPAKNT